MKINIPVVQFNHDEREILLKPFGKLLSDCPWLSYAKFGLVPSCPFCERDTYFVEGKLNPLRLPRSLFYILPLSLYPALFPIHRTSLVLYS